MARKVIITCAVTGSADTVAKNPAVPVTPAEIAQSALDAAKAGAAIVHVHVRDPESGKASMELDHYRETAGRIRQSETDVVLNLTTGYGARLSPGVDDPFDYGPGTTFTAPARRIAHVGELQARDLQPGRGDHELGRRARRQRHDQLAAATALHGRQHAGMGGGAGAGGLRRGRRAAGGEPDREGPCPGAGVLPALPGHRVGRTGDARRRSPT